MKTYLYNSLSNNGIRPEVAPGIELVDAVGIDYAEYLKSLAPEDEVVLIGRGLWRCLTVSRVIRKGGSGKQCQHQQAEHQ